MFTHRDGTNHGIDISKSRLDDLDREVLAFALAYKGKKVAVDLGCGSGRVSVMLALMGFDVYLYDTTDYSDYFTAVGEALSIKERLHFTQLDLTNLDRGDLPTDIVIAISQRTLHHIPYDNAKNVLTLVSNAMTDEACLSASFSGVESKLAGDYLCADSPVQKRFCEVGEVGKTIYSISGNVCLYTQEEVVALAQECRLSVKKIHTSAFGNIKLVSNKA